MRSIPIPHNCDTRSWAVEGIIDGKAKMGPNDWAELGAIADDVGYATRFGNCSASTFQQPSRLTPPQHGDAENSDKRESTRNKLTTAMLLSEPHRDDEREQ